MVLHQQYENRKEFILLFLLLFLVKHRYLWWGHGEQMVRMIIYCVFPLEFPSILTGLYIMRTWGKPVTRIPCLPVAPCLMYELLISRFPILYPGFCSSMDDRRECCLFHILSVEMQPYKHGRLCWYLISLLFFFTEMSTVAENVWFYDPW